MMTQLFIRLKNFIDLDLRGEEGQTAVEYAMVIALVALVIVGLLAAGATGVFTSFWTSVKSKLTF
jgi:Flp pilus assembly pilin Flp